MISYLVFYIETITDRRGNRKDVWLLEIQNPRLVLQYRVWFRFYIMLVILSLALSIINCIVLLFFFVGLIGFSRVCPGDVYEVRYYFSRQEIRLKQFRNDSFSTLRKISYLILILL